ncbi:membrane protein insertion efficiency factor YidD [Helicobacter sp. 13S00401-1]|nr:membrane protein insertion efficiency factor YidD [Helicobacter sp. 13S00401-1]
MKYVSLVLISLYQRFISPLKKPTCIYHPTCSSYSFLNFKYNNFLLAFLLTLLRILRCNSLFKGGFNAPFILKLRLNKPKKSSIKQPIKSTSSKNLASKPAFLKLAPLLKQKNIIKIPHLRYLIFKYKVHNISLIKVEKFYIILV